MAKKGRIHNIVSEFDELDTVEIYCSVLEGKKQKGFLLNWLIRPWTFNGCYDEVSIGRPRLKYEFKWGDDILINTTRLVLVEKYDNELVSLLNDIQTSFY